MIPAWERCLHCNEFWCNVHEDHAFMCSCPAVEEWPVDPYTSWPPPGFVATWDKHTEGGGTQSPPPSA